MTIAPRSAAAVLLALSSRLACPASEMTEWAEAAFSPAAPSRVVPRPELVLRRQDHGQLQAGRSVLGTQLRIGGRDFQHGLGTHAASEIAVALPAGARSFEALAGVDNNQDTQGKFGTVDFTIEIAGREAFRSGTLRGGGAPVPVRVDIPAGASEIVLKTSPTPDGPAHDHADWADARLLLGDGSALWLDQLPQASGEFLPADRPPFSFVYGGKSSGDLLRGWPRKATRDERPDRVTHSIEWSDPETGLRLEASVTAFRGFEAVEWVLRLENRGTRDTPIIEKVQALDITLGTAGGDALVLDRIAGDTCSERSFSPLLREVKPGEEIGFAPTGGRPSNGEFPFFNLEHKGRGVLTAIGWTGQWAAALERSSSGPARLRAGMELTHLLLHPGEAIRTPRILLLAWSRGRLAAHNTFRRLLLAHYLPRLSGQPVLPCIAAQSFNRWAGGARPEWATEAGQIAAARIEREIGCDAHWLDAGWFVGDFPDGVGNWAPKPKEFPRGLRPIGDVCDGLGLKFLVWYEPERVAPGTRVARERPEFVLGGERGGLFNLGDPKARRWMTDLLIGQIADFGIDTYRNDFNMDPLPYWRANDPSDRQGMTEIRYVEGLYEMWDELRAKRPGMYLDDCASGGRRIDLEMCGRSIVQTRSDTACASGRSDWDQSQTYGLSLYLPSHATIGWDVGAYECRSSATAGFVGEWDLLDPSFPAGAARAALAEIRENQPYWYGDYYPLTPWALDADRWIAYQFHRPDLGAGMVLAFRRKDCPYPALEVRLEGLEPEKMYRVSFIDDERRSVSRDMAGRELAAAELRIEKPRGSLLVRYRVLDGR